MLQKLMLLVAVGSMVISMGCVSFATSGGDLSDREIVPNYTGVSNVVSHLTQSGDAATCKLTLTRKTSLSSVHGTFNLVNRSGDVIGTDRRNLTKSGASYSYSHSFSLPKRGKYHVKYTLKVYKNGKEIDKVTGKTNTVEH